MHITIINQYYPPDISPTGMLANSLAEHLASQGVHVTVIAGVGYADRLSANRLHHANVRVARVWIPRLGKKKLWRRCLACAWFFAASISHMLRAPRQDVVICLTTPPFILVAGVLKKILCRRTRLILWNMDAYPEVVERLGLIRSGGLISRGLQGLNRWSWRWLDHVVCLDEPMRSLLQARDRGQRPTPISVIPNWEPLASYPRLATPVDRHNRELIILYTGNMGHAHCFATMLKAAQRLQSAARPVQFVITGSGVQAEAVKLTVREFGLHNVNFLGYVSAEELRRLQATAGCALITLRDEMLGVVSPSKLHASLAMGLPILYVGPPSSNVDEAIRTYRCGISLRHGDIDGFVQFVDQLERNRAVRDGYRKHARRAFEANYCDQQALKKFARVIQAVTVMPKPANADAVSIRVARARAA